MTENQLRGLRIGIAGAMFLIAGIAGALLLAPGLFTMVAVPGLGIIGWGVVQSILPAKVPKVPKPGKSKSRP